MSGREEDSDGDRGSERTTRSGLVYGQTERKAVKSSIPAMAYQDDEDKGEPVNSRQIVFAVANERRALTSSSELSFDVAFHKERHTSKSVKI